MLLLHLFMLRRACVASTLVYCWFSFEGIFLALFFEYWFRFLSLLDCSLVLVYAPKSVGCSNLIEGLVLWSETNTYDVLIIFLLKEPLLLYFSERFSPLSFVKSSLNVILSSWRLYVAFLFLFMLRRALVVWVFWKT